jgi:Resolvase, N terminal domain
MSEHSKITASHRSRVAAIYVRQSTLAQLERNTESTARQYDLVERALALGWPHGQIRVIDADLGVSGSVLGQRAGFESLVADVALGQVGIDRVPNPRLPLVGGPAPNSGTPHARLIVPRGIQDATTLACRGTSEPSTCARQAQIVVSTTVPMASSGSIASSERAARLRPRMIPIATATMTTTTPSRTYRRYRAGGR